MSHRPVAQAVDPEAIEHLRARDPVLRALIDQLGPIEAHFEPDLWWSLVDAIVSQQLSVKAAETILSRIERLALEGQRPSPGDVLEMPEESLRACGLSRAKTAYVRDVAAKWLDGTLDPARIREADDAAVIQELTQVKGIGRWTAEMVLIFTLKRPDVLAVDDLGLQVAAQRLYGLEERPGRAEMARLGEPWKPFRTAASLYLWRSRRV